MAAGAREGAAAHGSGGGLIALLARAGAPRWRYLHGEVGVAVGWVGWASPCCPGMGARSRIARWKASQNDFQALRGAFRNLVVVRAAQLSRVIARHTGERRVDVYERLITRWTEPLARQTVTPPDPAERPLLHVGLDPEAWRNLLTRSEPPRAAGRVGWPTFSRVDDITSVPLNTLRHYLGRNQAG